MKPDEIPKPNDPSPSDAPQRATPSPRGAADGAAGVSSNTPPSNHHESGISAGGEDWVEEALYCEHQEFGDLTKRLDAAKVAAEAGEQCHEWTLGGVKFRCLTGTARAGRKGKQVAYRWRLESECGLVLLLMNRPDPHPTLPNGIARATSLPLLRQDPQNETLNLPPPNRLHPRDFPHFSKLSAGYWAAAGVDSPLSERMATSWIRLRLSRALGRASVLTQSSHLADS